MQSVKNPFIFLRTPLFLSQIDTVDISSSLRLVKLCNDDDLHSELQQKESRESSALAVIAREMELMGEKTTNCLLLQLYALPSPNFTVDSI